MDFSEKVLCDSRFVARECQSGPRRPDNTKEVVETVGVHCKKRTRADKNSIA
jgi:hypothetical protein